MGRSRMSGRGTSGKGDAIREPRCRHPAAARETRGRRRASLAPPACAYRSLPTAGSRCSAVAGPRSLPPAHLNSTTRSVASSSASTTFVKAWLAPAVTITSYCVLCVGRGVSRSKVRQACGGVLAQGQGRQAGHRRGGLLQQGASSGRHTSAHPRQPVLLRDLSPQRLAQRGQPLVWAVGGDRGVGGHGRSRRQRLRRRLPVHDA